MNATIAPKAPTAFSYSKWRHGGWYVNQVIYPSGASGCVSRNYPDKKWRIVCDSRQEPPTFESRDEAAREEWMLANGQLPAYAARAVVLEAQGLTNSGVVSAAVAEG